MKRLFTGILRLVVPAKTLTADDQKKLTATGLSPVVDRELIVGNVHLPLKLPLLSSRENLASSHY